mgnify:FL=1
MFCAIYVLVGSVKCMIVPVGLFADAKISPPLLCANSLQIIKPKPTQLFEIAKKKKVKVCVFFYSSLDRY